MVRLSFFPDIVRTAAIDLAIRRSLADSVATVLAEVSRVGVPFEGDVVSWRTELLARPAPAGLWACYHDLVQAVVRLDAHAISASASELLAALPAPKRTPGVVVTLTEDDLGSRDVARYRSVIDNDPERPLDLVAARPDDVARIAALAAEARALLVEAAPVLLDEIDTLGHRIVLATSRGPRGFGGAATVFLWGAVVLNPTRVPDRVTLVESLAHETAHALLFGLTLGADLTTNDPSERYGSPLRPDPRPIEGIVHATYVLARMIHALDRLRGAPQLDDGEHAVVERKLTHNLKNYAAGLETVEAHARFTADGASIFAACRQAMERRSSVAGPVVRRDEVRV